MKNEDDFNDPQAKGNLHEEYNIATGGNIDLDQVAVWRFRSDMAWDEMGIPPELRTPNSTIDEFKNLEKSNDIQMGLSDYTNRFRIYNAMAALSSVRDAKRKVREEKKPDYEGMLKYLEEGEEEE